jgi:hypothetical protein
VNIAIDPGSAGRGNAYVYARDTIRVAEFGRAADGHYPDVDTVVIERPQQDARSYGARPKDLIALAWSGALLAGVYVGQGARLVEYTPSAWKGSEPKPLMHKRLWAVLAEAERRELGGRATERAIMAAVEKGALSRWSKPGASYYPKSFTAHNTLDACSLYAYYVGRLKRVA